MGPLPFSAGYVSEQLRIEAVQSPSAVLHPRTYDAVAAATYRLPGFPLICKVGMSHFRVDMSDTVAEQTLGLPDTIRGITEHLTEDGKLVLFATKQVARRIVWWTI